MNLLSPILLAAALPFASGGCAAPDPISTVEHVDLDRFMGDWYVLAHVPAGIEKSACNAVESYQLADDGTIATTYTFRKGTPDGPRKTYRPRGFVHDTDSNAEWRMQFLWPFKAEYLVAWLDEDYAVTIIARSKRDMAWIMARTHELPSGQLEALIDRLVAMGYEREDVRVVPHDWSAE